MILAVGIDAIEIERFTRFATYPKKILRKTFSSLEIIYCLENHLKSAERFAARFAAKEAFYKAFCAAFPEIILKPNYVFRYSSLEHQKNGHAKLIVDWKYLLQSYDIIPPEIVLSITHTKTVATAIVILQKN